MGLLRERVEACIVPLKARIDRPVDKRRASHLLSLPRLQPKKVRAAGCASMPVELRLSSRLTLSGLVIAALAQLAEAL